MRTACLPTVSVVSKVSCRGWAGWVPTLGHTHPPLEGTWLQTYPSPGKRYPPSYGQTDTCENITFPQLRLRAVKTTLFQMGKTRLCFRPSLFFVVGWCELTDARCVCWKRAWFLRGTNKFSKIHSSYSQTGKLALLVTLYFHIYICSFIPYLHHLMSIDLNVNLDISGEIELCFKFADFLGLVYLWWHS